MPDRAWSSRHRPPALSDHLASHMYEVCIAGIGMLVGATMLFSVAVPFTIAASLDAMHSLATLADGLLMLVGGFFIFKGVTDDSDDLVVGWKWERVGLILSASGWIGWGLSVGYSYRSATVTWVLAILVGVMHLIRTLLTFADEGETRRSIKREVG